VERKFAVDMCHDDVAGCSFEGDAANALMEQVSFHSTLGWSYYFVMGVHESTNLIMNKRP
jgi:hypothetical protein